MKRALKVAGWMLLIAAAIGIMAIAYLGDIKWLQWLLFVVFMLWMAQKTVTDYEARKQAQYDYLVQRLAQIEQLSLDNRKFLAHITDRLKG